MIVAALGHLIGCVLLVLLAATIVAAHGRDVAIDAAEIAIEADRRICADCTRRSARLPFMLALLLGSTSVCVAVLTVIRHRRWPEPMAVELARCIVRTESGIAVTHAPGAVRHGDDDEAAER